MAQPVEHFNRLLEADPTWKGFKRVNTVPQAGVIPYRRLNGQLEFCLITSLTDGRWCFPKGSIDRGETTQQAALREAFEEAGIVGRLVGEPVGCFQYEKARRTLSVQVWLMEVNDCRDAWQEQDRRQRRWSAAAEAELLLIYPDQRRLLGLAVKRLTD